MSDEKKFPAAREAIRDYCLMVCEKKDRANSRRAVAECPEIKCPLYAYRTGLFRPERGVVSRTKKSRKILALDTVRKRADKARDNLNAAKRVADRKEDIWKESLREVRNKEKELDEIMEEVRKTEAEFDQELEAGIWG